MNRTPEPELMASEEQARVYAGADLSELHQPMVECFANRFGVAIAGRLLDLGCGSADMTIRFVRAFPDLCALGVDGSEAMLRQGWEAVERASLSASITLEHRHLPDPELETKSFDVVVANSVLHHVIDPQAFWETVQRCPRSGAAVMVADLRRPSGPEAARQLVEKYASHAAPVLRRDFFNSLCAAYTAGEIRSQLRVAGLPHFEVEELGDLHVLVWGRAR